MPKRSDHINEDARAFALNRCRVRTLHKREDLVQPRRRDILTIRGQRQIVAILGYFGGRSIPATPNTMDNNCFTNSPLPLHKCFVTPIALTWTISTISEVG